MRGIRVSTYYDRLEACIQASARRAYFDLSETQCGVCLYACIQAYRGSLRITFVISADRPEVFKVGFGATTDGNR
jgi:hypothetical protein